MREREESTIERTENKWNSPNRESKMEHLLTISNTLKKVQNMSDSMPIFI